MDRNNVTFQLLIVLSSPSSRSSLDRRKKNQKELNPETKGPKQKSLDTSMGSVVLLPKDSGGVVSFYITPQASLNILLMKYEGYEGLRTCLV